MSRRSDRVARLISALTAPPSRTELGEEETIRGYYRRSSAGAETLTHPAAPGSGGAPGATVRPFPSGGRDVTDRGRRLRSSHVVLALNLAAAAVVVAAFAGVSAWRPSQTPPVLPDADTGGTAPAVPGVPPTSTTTTTRPPVTTTAPPVTTTPAEARPTTTTTPGDTSSAGTTAACPPPPTGPPPSADPSDGSRPPPPPDGCPPDASPGAGPGPAPSGSPPPDGGGGPGPAPGPSNG